MRHFNHIKHIQTGLPFIWDITRNTEVYGSHNVVHRYDKTGYLTMECKIKSDSRVCGSHFGVYGKNCDSGEYGSHNEVIGTLFVWISHWLVGQNQDLTSCCCVLWYPLALCGHPETSCWWRGQQQTPRMWYRQWWTLWCPVVWNTHNTLLHCYTHISSTHARLWWAVDLVLLLLDLYSKPQSARKVHVGHCHIMFNDLEYCKILWFRTIKLSI